MTVRSFHASLVVFCLVLCAPAALAQQTLERQALERSLILGDDAAAQVRARTAGLSRDDLARSSLALQILEDGAFARLRNALAAMRVEDYARLRAAVARVPARDPAAVRASIARLAGSQFDEVWDATRSAGDITISRFAVALQQLQEQNFARFRSFLAQHPLVIARIRSALAQQQARTAAARTQAARVQAARVQAARVQAARVQTARSEAARTASVRANAARSAEGRSSNTVGGRGGPSTPGVSVAASASSGGAASASTSVDVASVRGGR